MGEQSAKKRWLLFKLITVFYSRHSRETYNSLTNWLTDARTLASPNIVIILIGNKKDLDNDREVTFLEASRFAQENGQCVFAVFQGGLSATQVHLLPVYNLHLTTPDHNIILQYPVIWKVSGPIWWPVTAIQFFHIFTIKRKEMGNIFVIDLVDRQEAGNSQVVISKMAAFKKVMKEKCMGKLKAPSHNIDILQKEEIVIQSLRISTKIQWH